MLCFLLVDNNENVNPVGLCHPDSAFFGFPDFELLGSCIPLTFIFYH